MTKTKKQRKITAFGIGIIIIAFFVFMFIFGDKLAITSGNLEYIKGKCGLNNFYNVYDCNGYFCIDSLSGRCVDVDENCKSKNEVIYNCLNLVPIQTTENVWYITGVGCDKTTTDSYFYKINPNKQWFKTQEDCFKADNPSTITCYYCSAGQLQYTIGNYVDCSEIGKSDASKEKISCLSTCVPKWNKFLIGNCVDSKQKIDWYDDNNCNMISSKPVITEEKCISNGKIDGGEKIFCAQISGFLCNKQTKELREYTSGCIKNDLEKIDFQSDLSLCKTTKMIENTAKKCLAIDPIECKKNEELKIFKDNNNCDYTKCVLKILPKIECTKFQSLKSGKCIFDFNKFIKNTTVLVSLITGFILLIVIIFLVFLPKKGRRKI